MIDDNRRREDVQLRADGVLVLANVGGEVRLRGEVDEGAEVLRSRVLQIRPISQIYSSQGCGGVRSNVGGDGNLAGLARGSSLRLSFACRLAVPHNATQRTIFLRYNS